MKRCHHILLLLFALMVNKTFAQQNAKVTNADASLMHDHLQIEKEYLEKAKQNIETYRKGDASLTILDADGNPVKNAMVTINQVTQDFLFGNLCEEVFSPRISPQDSITFTKRFTDLFQLHRNSGH